MALGNDELRTRIRQTFHIQYLRDVIMAGVIDDQVCATINSFVIYNQMDIVALVRRDPDVLQQLLRQMQDPDDSDASFLDKLLFIHELCTLAKVSVMRRQRERARVRDGYAHVLVLNHHVCRCATWLGAWSCMGC